MKRSWGMVLFVLFFLTPVMAQVGSQIPKEKPKSLLDLLYIALVVIAVNIAIWIREGFKHLDFRRKNGVINDIKTDTSDLKTGMKLMAGQLKTQENNCGTTTKRFDVELSKNQSMIIKHIERG